MFFSEIFSVEDCRFYDATEYSESNNVENSKHGTYDWLSSFSLEVDFKASAVNGARFMLTDSSVSSISDNRYILTSAGFATSGVKIAQIYTTSNSTQNGSTGSANTYMHFKFEKYSDNTVKVYVDDVLLNTGTLRTYSENTFDTRTVSYNGRKTLYWKNLKIKPL